MNYRQWYFYGLLHMKLYLDKDYWLFSYNPSNLIAAVAYKPVRSNSLATAGNEALETNGNGPFKCEIDIKRSIESNGSQLV